MVEFLRLVYAIYPAQSFKLYLWFDLIDLIDGLVNVSALFFFSGMFLCKSQNQEEGRVTDFNQTGGSLQQQNVFHQMPIRHLQFD